MIAATDLAAAKLWYTNGGNSQKSGGRTRTVRGFSTAAKKKSKPSEISNPRALATCQLPRATAPFIECPGIAH